MPQVMDAERPVDAREDLRRSERTANARDGKRLPRLIDEDVLREARTRAADVERRRAPVADRDCRWRLRLPREHEDEALREIDLRPGKRAEVREPEPRLEREVEEGTRVLEARERVTRRRALGPSAAAEIPLRAEARARGDGALRAADCDHRAEAAFIVERGEEPQAFGIRELVLRLVLLVADHTLAERKLLEEVVVDRLAEQDDENGDVAVHGRTREALRLQLDGERVHLARANLVHRRRAERREEAFRNEGVLVLRLRSEFGADLLEVACDELAEGHRARVGRRRVPAVHLVAELPPQPLCLPRVRRPDRAAAADAALAAIHVDIEVRGLRARVEREPRHPVGDVVAIALLGRAHAIVRVGAIRGTLRVARSASAACTAASS